MSTPPAVRKHVADRFASFGETIFAEISRLAIEHDAVNLGQGFPNFDGPEFVKSAAKNAIDAGENQYARMSGIPTLNRRIAERFAARTNLDVDADAEITVTAGCTEALAATFLGVVNPGDEVILFEPFYDSYRACVAMAGATPRYVTLRPPEFTIEANALREVISDKTRAILINTPHNPTGRVFSRDEIQTVASICVEHDLLAFTDEVYEELVFDGEHISLAAFDGMRDRTITLSSLGKTFSLTGWKIGWAIAPPHLTQAVRAAHQYLTFAVATPLQHGAAAALDAPYEYYEDFRNAYCDRRDLLCDGLTDVGFNVHVPQGGYFVMADHTPFGFDDDVAFVRHLIENVGVAAIPPSAFYARSDDGKSMTRFAFCKDEDTLRAALDRLTALR